MRILLMSTPAAGKTTFWRKYGGVDGGGHRGSKGGIKKQGNYKNITLMDQPYSGAGSQASIKRYFSLMNYDRKKPANELKPICFLGGKFHLPATKHKDITFLCVILSDEKLMENCELRKEGGKFPNRKWANINRVLDYKKKLVEYINRYGIKSFDSFEQALDSVI